MRNDSGALRLSVFGVVIVCMFVAMFGRLWFLQVASPTTSEAAVRQLRTTTVLLPPMRGRLYDREGRILADNKRSLTVTVDRAQISKSSVRSDLFQRLAARLSTTPEDLELRFTSDQFDPLLPLPLAEGVDEQTVVWLKERQEDYPGVSTEEGFTRYYRYAPLASHVLGYTGRISADSTKKSLNEQAKELAKQGYRLSDTVGKEGIERQFEAELRGKSGYVKYEVDAANKPVREVERVEPIPGNDIVLSLDLKLQQYAEQILRAELFKRRTEVTRELVDINGNVSNTGDIGIAYPATAGSAVLEDVATGEILAMASYPSYDNRWLVGGIPDKTYKQLYGDQTLAPIVNRAISGHYLIGSTMKPFTAYAGLKTGLIAPDTIVNDTGIYHIPDCTDADERVAGCTRKNAGGARYGHLTVAEALPVSSDFFFYDLGWRLYKETQGTNVLQTELRHFGFGERTGIDLPSENPGRIPDKASKKALADLGVISKQAGSDYFGGDNMQVAIGQGLVDVSPLQLTGAYATMARDDGQRVRPLITRAVLPPGTPDVTSGVADLDHVDLTTIRPTTPQVVDTVDQLPQFHDLLVTALRNVLSQKAFGLDPPYLQHFATGKDAFANYPYKDTYPIAGKTGTAQTGDGSKSELDTSAFGGFAGPTGEPPKFAAAAILEKSGYGSEAAALVVKCLFEKMADPTTLPDVNQSPQLDRSKLNAYPLPPLNDDVSCLEYKPGQKD